MVDGTLVDSGTAIFWFTALTSFRDFWRRRHGLSPRREMGDRSVDGR